MKSKIIFMISFFLIIVFVFTDKQPYDRYKGKNLALETDNKALFWFSGIHSNDPDHEMFKDIEDAFDRFKADYVLVEGDFNDDKYKFIKDPRKARLYGESAYVTYLSVKNSIPVSSIEPPVEEQLKFLQRNYTNSDILAMYMLRQINQIQRENINKKIDFFDYMQNFTTKYQNLNKTTKVDKNTIIRLLEPHIGFEVNDKNWHEIDAYGIVYKEKSIINDIYTDILAFRDKYSVEVIKEKLKSNDRLFIMMGADHIKTQRESLEKYFDEL